MIYTIQPYAFFGGPASDSHPDDDGHDVYAVNREQYVVGHFNPIVTFAMYVQIYFFFFMLLTSLTFTLRNN